MPSFNDHHSNNIVKALICGDSGSGKTGSLATLANGGYNVRVVDFDNGLDVLKAYLTKEGSQRVTYKTYDIADRTSPDAAFKLMQHWKTPEEDLGATTTWGPKDVLVLDSLSFFGQSAIRAVVSANGKDYDKTNSFDQSYWGVAMKSVEQVVNYLTSPKVGCNVIVFTHLKWQENDQGMLKAYPNTLGKAFSPVVGRYFNNLWRLDVKPNGTRVIRTAADNYMSLKSSRPDKVKPEEEFDLSKMFDKLLAS